MMTLRTDIDQIHTDGRHVIVGTMGGSVLISRFIPPNKWHPSGHWSGLASNDWPVAWCDIPEHPYFPQGSKPLLSGEVAKA